MCKKCGDPLCFSGNCQPPRPVRRDPPSNLTENDLHRGGWNDDISEEDYKKFLEQAKVAVEHPTAAWNKVFGR